MSNTLEFFNFTHTLTVELPAMLDQMFQHRWREVESIVDLSAIRLLFLHSTDAHDVITKLRIYLEKQKLLSQKVSPQQRSIVDISMTAESDVIVVAILDQHEFSSTLSRILVNPRKLGLLPSWATWT